jgi:hypothetical protein
MCGIRISEMICARISVIAVNKFPNGYYLLQFYTRQNKKMAESAWRAVANKKKKGEVKV